MPADSIRGVLTGWMAAPPTLVTVGTPDLGIGIYKPAVGSLGEQIRSLAQRIGWDVRYRWNETAQDYRLTLSLPPRDKTVADLAVGADELFAVPGLKQSRQYVRNAFPVTHTEGGQVATVTVTDADSIAEYGRRAMMITEPDLDETQATALGEYAKSDLARPLVDGRYEMTFLPWLELHDLLTIEADDDHFDYDTSFAVVGVSHRVDPEGGAWTEIEVRGGAPVGQYYAWHRRSASPSEFAEGSDTIQNLRETGRTTTTVTYSWEWGAQVLAIQLQTATVAQPVAADSWPDPTSGSYTQLFTNPTTEVSYTFTIPPPGRAVLAQFVPVLPGGTAGPMERVTIHPTATEPDIINTVVALVNDDDGSVTVRVSGASRTLSYRYAYAAGTAPSWPSDATVEAGTARVLTSGADTLTLPAGTVAYNQTFRIRVAPYYNADGTGTTGATDHGEILGAEDIRLDPPVALDPATISESATTGTYGVTVRDAGGFATGLYKYVKSGAAAWVGPTLVTATPVSGTEYQATVTLEEDHQSAIKFRLSFSLNGSAGYVESVSPAFDAGKLPEITIVPSIDEAARTGSAAVSGDYDTASVKIAASTSGYPSAATVRAATAINGRNLTAAAIGALVSNLSAGQTVYYAAFGYSGAGGTGNETTSLVLAQAVVGTVVPMLEVASESESSTTGTFGVTLRDPSGISTGLYYRTKSGSGSWSGWTLQTGTPSTGSTYTQTVGLVEDHPSFVEFRLDYTLLGVARSLSAKSSAFDKGQIPNIVIVPKIDASGNVSCEVVGDFDTASVKVVASKSGYPSDATVRAAAYGNGRVIPASTVGTMVTLNAGETAYIKGFGYSATNAGGNESSAAATATITRDTPKLPKVQATASRSGSTATLTLAIEDLALRVTAVEWESQLQGAAGGGYSGTWSSSTGTIGVSTSLSRAQSITLTDGKDLVVRYRIVFTDENGASKTIGDTVSVANLASLTKTIRIPHTDLVPESPTYAWLYSVAAAGVGSVSTCVYAGAAVIPEGVTVTQIRANLYKAAAGDGATANINRISNAGVATALASVTHSGTGWSGPTASLSETVGTDAYVWEVTLNSATGTNTAKVASLEVTYTVPDYSKSY